MVTQVKKHIGFDRMTFTATFQNGDILKFNISRYRDTWKLNQLKDAKPVTQAEFDAVVKLGALGETGNHMQRYEQMEALCLKAGSVSELATMKVEA